MMLEWAREAGRLQIPQHNWIGILNGKKLEEKKARGVSRNLHVLEIEPQNHFRCMTYALIYVYIAQ